MELSWDDFVQLLWPFESTARWMFRWGVWLVTGKFMPEMCAWCRLVWMAGLAGVAIFGIVHLKGPRD